MRKIFLGALILFLTMSASEKVLAWEGGSTGWCTDENGRNFRCDEGGSSYSPPSTSESPVYMPPDNTPPVYTPPPETEERRQARELNKECNEKYWDKEDYANAVSCYEKVLNIFPSESVVENNLRRARQAKINVEGKQYYHDHNWEMAVNSFKEALTYGPNSDIEYNLRLAEDSLKKEGQRKKAIALNDNECIQYRLCGDFDKAISCYEKAVSLYPSDTVIQNNLKLAKQDKANITGLAYFNEGNWQTAITYFKEALTYGSDSNVKINLVRAEAMLKLEEQEKAEQRHGSNLAEAKKRIKNMLDNLVIDFDGATTGSAAGSSSALSFIDPSQAGGQGPAVVVAGKPPSDGRVVTPTTDSQNVDYLKQRTNFESEYWDLEDKISKEKDPIKRMEMINRQTYIKSQIGVLELKILAQYKEEQEMTAWKEKRVKGLLEFAALEMTYRLLHHDECLEFLQSALKEAPGDKGIERAINYVYYLKELGPGLEYDPKFSVLVDALTYGDWNATFAYLERAAKDNPDDLVIRDALNVLDGISTHSAYNWEDMRKREVVEAHKAIAEGLDAVLQNDFESAYKLFKQARKLAPDDAGVRDAMYFADGVIFKSPRGKSGEWQMEKGFEWEIYTNELFPETQRSDEVHKLYLKALDKIPSGNYEGALKFLKQLYKRNPADQEIRDKINWLEGICSQRYSVTRQKNKAVSREAK